MPRRQGSKTPGRILRTGCTSLRHLLILLAVAACLPFAALAAETEADAEAQSDAAPAVERAPNDPKSDWLSFMPGEMGKDAIFLGMWSEHFIAGNEGHNTNNDLLGISYAGFYAGSFRNSDYDRSWAVGVQRDFYRKRWAGGDLRFDAGYRFGILHGYESYQIGNSKLFPMLQVYGDVSYKRVGVQFSWAAEVVTAGFFFRFGD